MVSIIKHISPAVVFTCLANLTFGVNAQSLSIDKYAQAEQQLSKYTDKLVTGTTENPVWTNNNRLTYRSHTKQGEQFFIIDAESKEKNLAFDHQKLAAALSLATEQEVNTQKLPFTSFDEINKKTISVKIKDNFYQCDIKGYSCVQVKSTAKDSE